jgi:hypothetical protein
MLISESQRFLSAWVKQVPPYEAHQRKPLAVLTLPTVLKRLAASSASGNDWMSEGNFTR